MRAVLLTTAVLAVAACTSPSRGEPGTAVVRRVVDGDTVEVEVAGRDERVRLLGIDTPELHVEDGPPECWGAEASAFTARLLPPGTPVRLERDVVARDDYGRLLAYVYLTDERSSMVNELIVRRGHARILVIEPNGVHRDRLVAAARAAELAGLGLWGACAG